ncbi:MAG TPA: NAD(P)/FAD-dependent oxidoreductase [Candidatus Manganitrophaceae bacterium]|nr:NAD(P)/FAD-dependent oxidoreductase [Candidatus Manganitrophaceae bacterium]
MSRSKQWDLVIVGGGTGGLVLALELAKKGYRIAILDRQPRSAAPPRGEILQPNGLKVLDRLGLLPDLLNGDTYRNHQVRFRQASGAPLCTVDYQRLPAPYSYSLILLPEAIQRLLFQKVAVSPDIEIFRGASFLSILREREDVAGVEAEQEGGRMTLRAPVVVGGDGVRSAVRGAFRIPFKLRLYRDGYLTAVIERPPGFQAESLYYLGKGTILGAFPVSREKLYLFYMIPAGDLDRYQGEGLDRLKEKILSMGPDIRALLEVPLKRLSSWKEISFMPCFKVRCGTWVVQGGALLGDAAHAMNPHVAQGRNSAMEDAMALAGALEESFRKGDFSRKSLLAYERSRRPPVDALQRIGDEMAWLWNSGFAPVVSLRNRVFRGVHAERELHDKMLWTVSGLKTAPFNLYDRWRALSPRPGPPV